MNIISWNCRGMGSKRKLESIKDLLKKKTYYSPTPRDKARG
jgi:hypothetical protein